MFNLKLIEWSKKRDRTHDLFFISIQIHAYFLPLENKGYFCGNFFHGKVFPKEINKKFPSWFFIRDYEQRQIIYVYETFGIHDHGNCPGFFFL